MRIPQIKHPVLYALLGVLFLINIAFWSGTRYLRANWDNVPVPPAKETMVMAMLGDTQFAYRVMSIMLQNFGEIGGRSTAFEDYNYENLGKWFYLGDSLDSQSNFVPLLAAYYFGASRVKEDLNYVTDYLAEVGRRQIGQKWRWLAQAIFITKFQQQDPEKALKLSYELAEMWKPGMPGWAKQMPAFILADMGEKEASYTFLLSLLQDDSEKYHPAEVNFMVDYICTRILDKNEALQDPLCAQIKW